MKEDKPTARARAFVPSVRMVCVDFGEGSVGVENL
jgi:hypothetical protein